MKRLAHSWQYVVYDLGNGKVRKVKLSRFYQFIVILLDSKLAIHKALYEIKRINEQEKKSNDFIIRNLGKLDPEILGNPNFISESCYEQDKVEILEDILNRCNIEEGKKVFDDYINLIQKTWEYGFADSVYTFTRNNGINRSNVMIQLDFGELSLLKEEVGKQILSKQWLDSYSYTRFPEGELKEYYKQQMDERITIEKLDSIWNKRSIT